jgi:hypothetical protein
VAQYLNFKSNGRFVVRPGPKPHSTHLPDDRAPRLSSSTDANAVCHQMD